MVLLLNSTNFTLIRFIRQNDEHLLSTDFDSDLSSTKAAFDVFLDELFEIPHKVKASRMKKQPLLPLGELSTNQQHNNKVSLAGNKTRKIKVKIH